MVVSQDNLIAIGLYNILWRMSEQFLKDKLIKSLHCLIQHLVFGEPKLTKSFSN